MRRPRRTRILLPSDGPCFCTSRASSLSTPSTATFPFLPTNDHHHCPSYPPRSRNHRRSDPMTPALQPQAGRARPRSHQSVTTYQGWWQPWLSRCWTRYEVISSILLLLTWVGSSPEFLVPHHKVNGENRIFSPRQVKVAIPNSLYHPSQR